MGVGDEKQERLSDFFKTTHQVGGRVNFEMQKSWPPRGMPVHLVNTKEIADIHLLRNAWKLETPMSSIWEEHLNL